MEVLLNLRGVFYLLLCKVTAKGMNSQGLSGLLKGVVMYVARKRQRIFAKKLMGNYMAIICYRKEHAPLSV